MQHYERNIKLLSEYQPEVFKKINTEPKLKFDNIEVGFGANNDGVIDNVVTKIGDKMYTDSKGADSETWIKFVNPNLHTIVVFGIGLGYHIEKLIDTYPDKKVFVIEPDKRMLAHAMHLKDFEKIFKNTTIWLDEEVDLVRTRIFEMITHPLARGIQFVPYVGLYQQYITELMGALQRMLNDWAVMVNTKRCLVDKWYLNRFENVKRETASAKSLIGKFKDVPAILVGAGPSLQTQIERLKSLQNKAVIIAASTAVEILNTQGIRPTFAIAIDQDPVTSGGLHENLDSDVPLLYDGQVAQNSLNYKAKKFQFCLNVNKYTSMIIPDLPVFESGPSVANVALDFLHKIGCSPILLVGIDLSYTNNKLYCDGTKFNQDMNQNNMIRLPNNKGELCGTEPSFLAMRNWFEEYAGRVKPNAFNCTESGLPIKNIPNRDFSEFAFDTEYDFNALIQYEPVAANYKAVNDELIADLDNIKNALSAEKKLTPQLQQTRGWTLVDEFVQSMLYLEEIRCESRIKRGMDVGESITIFHNKRIELINEAADKLKEMLK